MEKASFIMNLLHVVSQWTVLFGGHEQGQDKEET
jgi:hypothetical protein